MANTSKKSEALRLERKTLETSKSQPVFLRQRTLLRTPVDDWDFLTPDERRALVADVSEEIRAGENGIEDFLPREVWKQYMRAVVPADADEVPTERKTGLFRTTSTRRRQVQIRARDSRIVVGLAA